MRRNSASWTSPSTYPIFREIFAQISLVVTDIDFYLNNLCFLATADVDTSQEHHSDEEKKQAALKAYYDSFPDVDKATNEATPDVKQAEQFTKSILNNEPSGNVTERDTVCHLLSQLFGSQEQECLFYDSENGINLHDASGNLADINSQDKPFVLKLNSSEGLDGSNDPKTEQNDVKLAETLNNVIEKNETHPVIEDIRDRLAKAHGVDKKYIVIKNVYAGTFNVVYSVLDLDQQVVEKNTNITEKLKTQFNQFVSAKIHPLLYRPSFDISLFDVRGNKTFGSQSETHQVGPPGRTKSYTTPSGWTRYGLKVLGKYKDDKWLHPFGDAQNWYRAFHGTGRAESVDFSGSNAYSEKQYASVDAVSSIVQTAFRPARIAAYGPGVYCSPDPTFPEKGYVGAVSLNTKQGPKIFKCMLQVAVNPDGIKGEPNTPSTIWVVPNPQDIRPYGILIKEA